MLLHIDDLHLSIGDQSILHGVNLTLHEGQIYGLLGPNGAGKSTTIAAILGLLPPDNGWIRVFGRPLRRDAPDLRQGVGVLPEQNGFYEWMGAGAYLSFFASLHGLQLEPTRLRQRLEMVGLEVRPDKAIATYSQGMRQRLGLARALLGDPRLLVLDEPTNGLDPRGRSEIHDILLGLAKAGVGILLCSHLLDDVERLCQRIGIIVAGRTVAEGDLAELVGSTGLKARYHLRLAEALSNALQAGPTMVKIITAKEDWLLVELAEGVQPEDAWRELLFAGWPVVEIRRAGGGLEQTYLKLTEEKAS